MARLLKIALVVGLVVGAGIELGRPAVARVELDGAAQDAADSAGRALDDRGDQRMAAAEARTLVESRGAALTEFVVRPDGRVDVGVAKAVDPYVLDGVSQLDGWFDVDARATSASGLEG